MAYVKKPRRKIKWKVVTPLVCLLLAMAYFVVTILIPQPKNEETKRICNYDVERTTKLLDKEYENTYMVSDYFFYGETLTFLKDNYQLGKADDLYGKTIKLRNLCNGNEILFQLNNTIDQQVELGELEAGFYEVFVVNNLQEYRMISSIDINEEFHTITRNEKSNKIELIATNHYLDKKELNQKYVYLNISEEETQKDTYDILIDPFGGNNDYGLGVDWGYEINDLVENDEMYKAGLVLKEKLEAYGLKVGITKNAIDQKLNTNGEDGRMKMGYDNQAKLYVNLQFNASTYSETKGIEVMHSAYSSSKLANQIIHDLEANVGLLGSLLYPGTIQNGATTGYLAKGDGEERIYDGDIFVRESGGKATGAGQLTEETRKLNAFATNNPKGMQGLMVKVVYVSNPLDYKMWIDHYEDIMSSMADSIATYYQLEKEGK